MDHFLPSHQNFGQNSTRNSKIMVLKFFVKKWQKNCSVQGLKINFWIQCFYRIFWHVSMIQKSYPIWMRPKVEVKSLLSGLCRVRELLSFNNLWVQRVQLFIFIFECWFCMQAMENCILKILVNNFYGFAPKFLMWLHFLS